VLRIQRKATGAGGTTPVDDAQSYVRVVRADPANPSNLVESDYGRISPSVLYSSKYFFKDIAEGQDLVIPLTAEFLSRLSNNSTITLTLMGGHELENVDHFSQVNVHDLTVLAPDTPNLNLPKLEIQFAPPLAPQVLVQGTGTVSKSPDKTSYSAGETVTLTATPGRYYAFTRWSDGVTTNPRTITVGLGQTFTAEFTATVALENPVIKQWDKTYGAGSSERLKVVRQTSDGGYILGARRESSPDVPYVVKIDSAGTVQWERSYGGTQNESVADILQSSDGGYIIGVTRSSSGLPSDHRVIRTDSTGNTIWNRTYGGDGASG
jgi:hypothetical protein